MYHLKLFHRSDPDRQIEMRVIKGGELTVGRGPGVGWKVDDPVRAISRTHCVFSLEGGRLAVRDISSNGLVLESRGQAAPKGEAVAIESGEAIRLGDFKIVVEDAAVAERREAVVDNFTGVGALTPGSSPFAPPASGAPSPERPYDADGTVIGLRRDAGRDGASGFDAPFVRPILEAPSVKAADLAIPEDWGAGGAIPAQAPSAAGDEADPTAVQLFEAFCAGARLDPHAFAREDRVQLMRNLGAVYQQMVLGLGDLLSERTSVKTEYRMERTTVRLEGNNPFKWSSPARVAVDLLRATDDDFLTGPAAVKESCEDLKRHLLCVLAGLRAALSSTLEALRPEVVESRVNGGGGLFGASREARVWAEYRRAFADLKKQADDNPDSQINRDFRAGYEKQLAALDSLKRPR